jgi:DNA-damage-inducible protein D
MQTDKIRQLLAAFEAAARHTEDVEYWEGRELQQLLGYTEWRNFTRVIEKAAQACRKSGQPVADHFVEVNKTIDMPKGAQKDVPDYLLTRYACYLVAQNGDPRKEEIAFAQSYFAVQTRKQELIEQRLKRTERLGAHRRLQAAEEELKALAFEREVQEPGFQSIREKGNTAFFGGVPGETLKARYGIAPHRNLDDFLPTLSLTAKQLIAEMTSQNVVVENLSGETAIGEAHELNSRGIREVLVARGIRPEDLPSEEDLQALGKKLQRRDRKVLKGGKRS